MNANVEKIVNKHSKSISLLSDKANKFKIRNDKDTIKATEFLIFLKTTLKKHEDERLTYTAPLNQSLKAINNTFKKITLPLKEAQDLIKTNILEYRKIQEEKRLLEESKLQKKNKDIKIENISKSIESESGKLTTTKKWIFEIIDETKIPREYLKVDDNKINDAIKAGERKISGIRIFEEENIRIY